MLTSELPAEEEEEDGEELDEEEEDDGDSPTRRSRVLNPHLAMEADNTAVLIAGFSKARRAGIVNQLVEAGE